jgi:hypothetical protein
MGRFRLVADQKVPAGADQQVSWLRLVQMSKFRVVTDQQVLAGC